MSDADALPPAYRLEGFDLAGGWHVDELIQQPASATGGEFSATYRASNNDQSGSNYGQKGFLKALDYSSALSSSDRADALRDLTMAYTHERDLIALCAERRMRHVVRGITSGQCTVPDSGELGHVDYLILEIARSDVRNVMDQMTNRDLVWVFETLHNVANGLRQLHGENITHQDLKPSNILDFGTRRKIADLGRAHCPSSVSPNDDLVIPGDRVYAPPEQLYTYTHPDEAFRRRAADLYQLGNLMLYLLTGMSLNATIYSHMAENHQPTHFGGSYFDVLPMLEVGFVRAQLNLESVLLCTLVDKTVSIFTQLAQPDIRRRGILRRPNETRMCVEVEHYVSVFDRLKSDASIAAV
ncbi:protein kinase domain-containing protein [Candidatus Poriferisodalis sp.]|uniref:protein kinase domain-containing protein n=1 Tax=Candidatus Poriferisodalis sp. TaxID=3101277 RepID=UPI003C6F1F82